MLPRLSILLFLIFLVSGCAKEQRYTYKPREYFPVSQSYELKNSQALDASFDSTWDAVLKIAKETGWIVQSAKKSDKLIAMTFSLPNPSEFIDCGTRIKVLQETGYDGKIIEIYHDDSISQVDWRLMDAEPEENLLHVRMNLEFDETTNKTTQVNVNAEYNIYFTTYSNMKKTVHEDEIEYTYFTQKIGNQLVTNKIPRKKTTTREVDDGIYMHEGHYKANTYYKEGEQCHSTQKLEQIILQKIADELQASDTSHDWRMNIST